MTHLLPERRTLRLTMAALVVGMLTACGVSNDQTTVVSGFVSKAPINGAECRLFDVNNQASSVLTTSTEGRVNFGEVRVSGVVYASCTGGTYRSEATGSTMTNTATLRAAATITPGQALTIVVSPLTEVAFQKAGGDPTRFADHIGLVAQAYGLGDVNLTTIVPTDLNTTRATADAAGRYGTVLAMLERWGRDSNRSSAEIVAALVQGTNTRTAAGDPVASIAAPLALALRQSAYNLSDRTLNANTAVVTNAADVNQIIARGLAGDQAPVASSIVLRDGQGQLATQPVFGQPYLVVVTGSNLQGTTIGGTGLTCNAPTIDDDGRSMRTACMMPSGGTNATINVLQAGIPVPGASSTMVLGDGTTSCASGAALVGAIGPTDVPYGQVGQVFTVSGCNLPDTTSVSLRSTSNGTLTNTPCAATANSTASERRFSCNITNDRGSFGGELQVSNIAGQAPRVIPVTYSRPAVTITGARLVSLTAGGFALSGMSISGTGLYTGMPIQLGDALCYGFGVANASGTATDGIDCSNVVVPSGASSVVLSGADGAQFNLLLTAAPATNLTLSLSANVVQLGAGSSVRAQATASANFTGAITYSSSNPSVATIDATTGAITPVGAGTTTITANQAAIQGVHQAGTASATLTVTDRAVPTLGFASPGAATARLGAADLVNPLSVRTCAAEAGYNPSVSYSSSNTSVATVDASGRVVMRAAGSASIRATVGATGACSAQETSYALTVQKARPSLAFESPPASLNIGTEAVAVARTTVPANLGSGGALPASTGVQRYTSTNPAVARVDDSGRITPLSGGTTTIVATIDADPNYLGSSDDASIRAEHTLTVIASFTIGGSITGLLEGDLVTLSSGSETLTRSNDGTFQFSGLYTGYQVTAIATLRDPWVTCTVSNGSGTTAGPVTNIQVACDTPRAAQVEVFAGGAAGFVDGFGTAAQFNVPYSVTMDWTESVIVADAGNHAIRRIRPNGEVTTLAGGGFGYAEGTGLSALFALPSAVTTDVFGRIVLTDMGNRRIRRLTLEGQTSLIAGSGDVGSLDGPGGQASFVRPQGLARDAADNLYVADFEGHRVRRIAPDGTVTTIAGSGAPGYADGVGANAMFNNPAGVAVDANWNVYVADSGNDRIRRIAPDGTVTTVAGGAGRGFTDGGPATAQFARPVGIAIDALGNILVSELDNSAIRRINRAGVTQTLSASMMIVNPYGLTVTASGTVYVANRGSHNILRLVPQ